MTEITMPKLSDSMVEGTILVWLRADGDAVAAGEELVEIETDKATVTHSAESAGILTIIAREGSTLAVGARIGRIVDAAEALVPETAPSDSDSSQATAPRPPASGSAPADSGARHDGRASGAVAKSGHAGAGNGRAGTGDVRVTPLARRAAARHGVALERVTGSGPLGRITRGDVLRAAGVDASVTAAPPDGVLAPAPPGQPAPPDGATGEVEVIEPTRLQALIARRMAETKATVPHFQVQCEATMDAAIALREQLKAIGAAMVPSLNDLIVKASALALRAHPRSNGAYRDGRFELYSRVNVAVAVAAAGVLVVPTIFDADVKALGAIAAETRRLAGRVREGTISPGELAGATFTVSNLGMYGMSAIMPVINGSQAAILGVGAIRTVLARAEGEIVERQLMTLTLSCDHRILYGADAAEFLSTIRGLLEQPLRLVL